MDDLASMNSYAKSDKADFVEEICRQGLDITEEAI
jgi:hypothetical protein